MGFFSEIRKLLFAKKSVVKSGYEKAKDEASEKLDQLSDKTSEWREDARETIDDLSDKGREWKDKAEDRLDSLVDAFTSDETDISEPEDIKGQSETSAMDASSDETISISNEVHKDHNPDDKSFVEEIGERTLSGAETLGENLKEASEQAGEKFGDLAEKVGKKVFEGKEKLTDKAKEAASYIDEKLDETVEKAKELDKELSKNDQDGDGFADEPADLSQSTLEGSDDFFEKAKRFSEGKPMQETEPTFQKGEKDPEKPTYKAYGMEDLDGDGNELIDDAIIDDQEE